MSKTPDVMRVSGTRLVLRHKVSRVPGSIISPWKFECGFCGREYRAHSQPHSFTRLFFHVKDYHPHLFNLYYPARSKES